MFESLTGDTLREQVLAHAESLTGDAMLRFPSG